MADFAVSTAFKAKDKISKSFRDMDKNASRFGRTASRSFRDASKSASRFRDVTKGILAAGVVTRGLSALTQGMRALTTQFIDFDQATIGAAARFKDIGPDAIDFEQQLKKIRDRAREAGATTEFTAAQSAKALNFLAKAGFTSAEAMGSLSSMINLATATGEDFATVADFSSDLLGAFGLNVDDTAQKIKNLARLNDVLVKASNTANVTVEDLFETMKIAAPIAVGLGQSLEDVTAVTAFLGGAGIKGSQAATALKNSFLNLAAPSSTASKMLRALGVDVDDGTGNMRNLNDIIGELAPELDKMGNIKAAKVLNEIFGKRAIAGAINIGKGTEAIRAFEKSLTSASGTAQRTAERLRQSVGNRLLALGSAASEFGFKIIEAFEVRGEGAIDKMTTAIRNFDPTPIIQFAEVMISTFKLLWSVVGPILSGIKQFIGFIAELTAVAFDSVLELITGIENIAIKFAKVIDSLPSILQTIDTAFGDILNPILSGISTVFEFIGIPAPPERKAERTAPNQEEAESRSEVNFNGNINLNGFPPGTTTDSETTGAPDIDMALLN